MIWEERKVYGEIRVLDIECTEPYEWHEENLTHIRVSVPAGSGHMQEMLRRGFRFADRLMDASINLMQSKMDYRKMIRLHPRLTSQRRDEVERIALESFQNDSRFYISLTSGGDAARAVLAGWVADLDEYYLCEHKGEVFGFLALRESGDMQAFIHLAAVDERFHSTGAAMSLYANAAAQCKERGYRLLKGRISTLNMAVINLYAFLGASFTNPVDVFIKEV